jgi:DNA-directed RNA polymerase specialized sigma24 family protein
MTDAELLQCYAATRDGDAFAEIVRRHGGMVHATARRLARDEAEDVTQAVFLLLAQKAGKLSRYRNLAGWLYNVTRYCASNARRTRGHVREGGGAVAVVSVAAEL